MPVELAKLKSRQTDYSFFSARKEYSDEWNGRSLEAFTKPASWGAVHPEFYEVPVDYYEARSRWFAEAIKQIMNEQKPVDDALAELEQRLQQELDWALSNNP